MEFCFIGAFIRIKKDDQNDDPFVVFIESHSELFAYVFIIILDCEFTFSWVLSSDFYGTTSRKNLSNVILLLFLPGALKAFLSQSHLYVNFIAYRFIWAI